MWKESDPFVTFLCLQFGSLRGCDEAGDVSEYYVLEQGETPHRLCLGSQLSHLLPPVGKVFQGILFGFWDTRNKLSKFTKIHAKKFSKKLQIETDTNQKQDKKSIKKTCQILKCD